jgi:microcompartment protein CcmK/EutM
MTVREISPQGDFIGNPFLAIDATSAGKGDTVIVVKDGGALQIITKSKKIPENAIIAAVVDNLQIIQTN